MIGIDLADPSVVTGPPPSHLLAPLWLGAVLLPLAFAGALHQQSGSLIAEAAALQQRVAEADAAETSAESAKRRAAMMRGLLSAADVLRRDAGAMQGLVPALAASLPAGVRLAEVRVLQGEVTATGSARGAAEVTEWLAAMTASGVQVEWGPAELNQPSPSARRIEFRLRGRYALRADGRAA